jgi:hypothetical protein
LPRGDKSYTDSYGDGEFTHANSYGNGYLYAGKSDPNSNFNSDGFAERDADTLGDPASADAKAAAHAVSSAYTLRMKDPDSRVISD